MTKHRINHDEFRRTRSLLEGSGVGPHNLKPVFDVLGLQTRPRLELHVVRYLADLDSQDPRLARTAVSVLETTRRRANGEYSTRPEDQVVYRKVLEEFDSGALTTAQAREIVSDDKAVSGLVARLRSPGPVFKAEDFKGGSVDLLTWVYVLRAHCRGRVHFHGKTLEQQEDLLTKALEHGSLLLSCLVTGQ